MIKHIVMWKFKQGNEAKVKEFLKKLSDLDGKIDVIKKMEIKESINKSNNYDAILISEFETMEDLQKYKTDERHVAVSNLCKSIRDDRASIDFVI